MKNYAIILASGEGTRFNSNIPKQFYKIKDKTILEHVLDTFSNIGLIDEIFVVITPKYFDVAKEIIEKNNYKKVTKILHGGKIRKESSYIGVFAINDDEANVIIHDVARVNISEEIITNSINALSSYKAVSVAIPSTDTIYEVDENDKIVEIKDRKFLKRAQTPQCFKLSVIKKAHEMAKNDDNFTDDAGLVLKYNVSDVYVICGSEDNIKVTYQNDLEYVEKFFL